MSTAPPAAGPPGYDDFESLTEPLLARPTVSRSTMMGLPCLRTDGAFFASFDTRTGRLLVKLPAAMVQTMVAAGAAEPFAPAGRTFREWAAIPPSRLDDWTDILTAALDYVAGQPDAPPTPRARGKRQRPA